MTLSSDLEPRFSSDPEENRRQYIQELNEKHPNLLYTHLPNRVARRLCETGIDSVGKLLSYSKNDLLKIDGIGHLTIKRICDFLADNGLSLISFGASYAYKMELKEIEKWYKAQIRILGSQKHEKYIAAKVKRDMYEQTPK